MRKRRSRLAEVARRAAAEIEARLRCCGRFRTCGVAFSHPGILVDQRACEAAVLDMLGGVDGETAAAQPRTRTRLRRVTVRIEASPRVGGAPVDVSAMWLGGWRDRGLVTLRDGDDVPARAAAGLRALLEADGLSLPEGRR